MKAIIQCAVRRSAWQLMIGLCVASALVLFVVPEGVGPRSWALAGLGLLSPWLVLGRDLVRRRDGLRQAAQIAPRTGWLVAAELLVPLLVIAAAMLLATRAVIPALPLIAWSALLMWTADALERRAARPGTAWALAWWGALIWCAVPLWAGPFFGTTAAAPWLATLAVGLHPAGAALNAAGQPATQDPWLYQATLSGVVEVRPLHWGWATAAFGAAALVAAVSAARAARRPAYREL